MFPETTVVGIAFNLFYDSFKQQDRNIAVDNFLQRYKTMALKSEIISVENALFAQQFVMKKDIWGPKEVFLVCKEGEFYDYMISYSTRNPDHYYPMAQYIANNEDEFQLENKTLNQGMYRQSRVGINFNIKESMIVLQKQHSQLYEVTAFIVL